MVRLGEVRGGEVSSDKIKIQPESCSRIANVLKSETVNVGTSKWLNSSMQVTRSPSIEQTSIVH